METKKLLIKFKIIIKLQEPKYVSIQKHRTLINLNFSFKLILRLMIFYLLAFILFFNMLIVEFCMFSIIFI